MKILVLSDQKGEKTGLKDVLLEILSEHQTASVTLNYKNLKPCVGCYGCWIKTPGLCVFTEDSGNELCKQEMNSDAVVILSELTYGGYSADIKSFLDRMISNISPFFKLSHKEMHHEMRYERFPAWITIGYGKSTEEEKRLFTELNERNSRNLFAENQGAITVENQEELRQAKERILALLRGERQ